MVGVPRSQGCSECLKVKKGCDLKRPSCGRCIRRGTQCIYEEPRWIFVDGQRPYQGRRQNRDTRRQGESSDAASDPIQARTLTRGALQIQTDEAFWSSYLPQVNNDDIGGIMASPLIPTLRYFAERDECTRTAIDACAFTALGRLEGNTGFVQQGIRLYGRVLNQLNRALRDPVQVKNDATLAACRVVCMYEVFRDNTKAGSASSGDDWQKHVDGTCRLIELRGPENHVSEHAHNMFDDARSAAIVSAMTSRKQSFFTSVEWRTIPWRETPRNVRDDLLDILILLPTWLQKQDELLNRITSGIPENDIPQLAAEGRHCIERCIYMAMLLQQWEQRALALHERSRGVHDPGQASQQEQMPIVSRAGTVFEICKAHGYGFFHMVALYWYACVMFFSRTRITHDAIANAISSLDDVRLPELPPWLDAAPYAAYIAECASHYFRPEAGLLGAQLASDSIGSAFHYYSEIGRHDSGDVTKLRRALKVSKIADFTCAFLISWAVDDSRIRQATRERSSTDVDRLSVELYRMEILSENPHHHE